MTAHNHVTRDIKERGKCPACDEHWDRERERRRAEMAKWCDFFWGSHGCDLEAGDHRVHQCGREPNEEELALIAEGDLDPDSFGPCCEYDEDRPADARVNWWYHDGTRSGWKPFGEGWRQ